MKFCAIRVNALLTLTFSLVVVPRGTRIHVVMSCYVPAYCKAKSHYVGRAATRPICTLQEMLMTGDVSDPEFNNIKHGTVSSTLTTYRTCNVENDGSGDRRMRPVLRKCEDCGKNITMWSFCVQISNSRQWSWKKCWAMTPVSGNINHFWIFESIFSDYCRQAGVWWLKSTNECMNVVPWNVLTERCCVRAGHTVLAGGRTVLREMTSWPPSWKCDVI